METNVANEIMLAMETLVWLDCYYVYGRDCLHGEMYVQVIFVCVRVLK